MFNRLLFKVFGVYLVLVGVGNIFFEGVFVLFGRILWLVVLLVVLSISFGLFFFFGVMGELGVEVLLWLVSFVFIDIAVFLVRVFLIFFFIYWKRNKYGLSFWKLIYNSF